ncbi:MAG: hypothetical protein H7338_21050 [Candidatus Sericytochromatia bacterium]|nr:hypothetical protein [Candidatus Sericytochromatia bacterium]
MRRSLLAISLVLSLAPQLALADALDDGMQLVRKGEFEKAVPLLIQAADANPTDPRPHEYLGKAYTGLFQPADALTEDALASDLRQRQRKFVPATKPRVDVNPLPPIYVRPGPRTSLPAITRDSLPKTTTNYKATPMDLPSPAKAPASDSLAAPTGVTNPVPMATSMPGPMATPTPAPNLQPVGETGLNAPMVTPPSVPYQ